MAAPGSEPQTGAMKHDRAQASCATTLQKQIDKGKTEEGHTREVSVSGHAATWPSDRVCTRWRHAGAAKGG